MERLRLLNSQKTIWKGGGRKTIKIKSYYWKSNPSDACLLNLTNSSPFHYSLKSNDKHI